MLGGVLRPVLDAVEQLFNEFIGLGANDLLKFCGGLIDTLGVEVWNLLLTS